MTTRIAAFYLFFPFPTFACVALWSVGRIAHQLGYASVYGKHAIGFVFSTLASVTIDGSHKLLAATGIVTHTKSSVQHNC